MRPFGKRCKVGGVAGASRSAASHSRHRAAASTAFGSCWLKGCPSEHDAAREGAKAGLGRVNRDFDRLVQALLDGAPARTVKDRMAQLEARKDVPEAQRAQGEDMKVAVHPNMARISRERVANLRTALAQEDCQVEAAEILRALIDRIELTPVRRDGKHTLPIALHGHLAGILALSANKKGPLDESDPMVRCTKLVAGAGFEPATFRL
jgi:site-specific DNA recombinase